MTETMTVRPATEADAALLFPLFKAFYGEHLRPAAVTAVARHLEAAASVDTVLLACVEGRPAGFARVRLILQVESDTPHAELSDLYVDPMARRQGVGRTLVHAAEDLARGRGVERMTLLADPADPGACAFYRACGYEDHLVAMRRQLEVGR